MMMGHEGMKPKRKPSMKEGRENISGKHPTQHSTTNSSAANSPKTNVGNIHMYMSCVCVCVCLPCPFCILFSIAADVGAVSAAVALFSQPNRDGQEMCTDCGCSVHHISIDFPSSPTSPSSSSLPLAIFIVPLSFSVVGAAAIAVGGGLFAL
jgi:hypothetical protein